MGRKPVNHVETDNSSPDSESSEATISISQSMSNNRNPVSDSTVFKYCLGSLTERALLLKEIAMSSSEQELVDFAEQVSLYSGCIHHRYIFRYSYNFVISVGIHHQAKLFISSDTLTILQ